MATIQKRKNKNGSLSYKVMIRPSDGLPATYKTFPTHQEAKDWSVQEEARRRQGVYFPEKIRQQHTLSELVDRYIEVKLPSIRSAEDTLRHLRWWKDRIGKYTLNRISSDLIGKYRAELLNEVLPQGKQRTVATANRYMASISSALSYGVKECEWLVSNPALRIQKLREPRGRDRVLSQEELPRLLDACKKSSNRLLYPFVVLAITTGARSGELLNLSWDCVNIETGAVHLKETKNDRPRMLVAVGEALDVLREMHINRFPDQTAVFPSRSRFGKLTLRKPWEKALLAAGITGFRVHDLRHCFSTYASETGASNIALQAATGHRTLSQLSRYCHPDTKQVKQLSDAVHRKIFNTSLQE